jgi:hypothetical protein
MCSLGEASDEQDGTRGQAFAAHHELANSCAQTFGTLKANARNRLRSMQRRPTLIRAFWQQAELPL